jgi:hypothetical protein
VPDSQMASCQARPQPMRHPGIAADPGQRGSMPCRPGQNPATRPYAELRDPAPRVGAPHAANPWRVPVHGWRRNSGVPRHPQCRTGWPHRQLAARGSAASAGSIATSSTAASTTSAAWLRAPPRRACAATARVRSEPPPAPHRRGRQDIPAHRPCARAHRACPPARSGCRRLQARLRTVSPPERRHPATAAVPAFCAFASQFSVHRNHKIGGKTDEAAGTRGYRTTRSACNAPAA